MNKIGKFKSILQDKTKKKIKVLILRSEGSLGDAILTSGYYESLKTFNKNVEIHLFCFHSAYEYAKNLKSVDHIYRIRMSKLRQHRGFISLFLLGLILRLKNMDIIIDDNPYDGKNWEMFISLLGKEKVISVPRIYPSPNARTEDVLKQLGVPYISPKIEILTEYKNKVVKFLTENNIDKYIVFNCFGSVSNRSFTCATFSKMLAEIRRKNKNIPVVFPYQPFQKKILKDFYHDDKNLFFFETSSPQDVFALIENSKNILLISPDTSFVHVAKILNKSTIDILREGNCYLSNNSFATEIFANRTDVNIFDFSLFTKALEKHLN